ncbi:MAG: DNA polymerase III subunit delta [Chlamydiales bacterium]
MQNFSTCCKEGNESSYLVISNDKNDSKEALCNSPIRERIYFDKENFDEIKFSLEFENSSFLATERLIVIHEVNCLTPNQQAVLIDAVERPCSGVSLFMIGEKLTPQHKLFKVVNARGVVLKLAEKKAWEKEQELSSWMSASAKNKGVLLRPDVATTWIKNFGGNKELLAQELEKMLCYVGYQGEITLAMVQQLSITLPHITLWQLSDAVFSLSVKQGIQVTQLLLEEGCSLFQIFAHLRAQFDVSLSILNIYKNRGASAVRDSYPYLKGAMLDKKISLLINFGITRIKKGIALLFETELQAKNQSLSHELLFEMFLVRLHG